MRILYFAILSLLILSSCGSKEETAQNKEIKTEQADQKQNPKAKVVKKTDKPDYWSEVQKILKITDEQLASLKSAKEAHTENLKGKKGEERRDLNIAFRSTVNNLLGEDRLGNIYRRFERDYNNPLSYYNLKRELLLTRPQIRDINALKKEGRVAIREIDSKGDERKTAIAKINRVELDKIMLLLTDQQKVQFDSLKNSIPAKRLDRLVIFQ